MCLHPNLTPREGGARCPDCGALVIACAGSSCACPDRDARRCIEIRAGVDAGAFDGANRPRCCCWCHDADDPGPLDVTDDECPDVTESDAALAGCAPEALALMRQKLDEFAAWAEGNGVVVPRRGLPS
jgi:hypothetical protein